MHAYIDDNTACDDDSEDGVSPGRKVTCLSVAISLHEDDDESDDGKNQHGELATSVKL